jgi:hypothetical protein
MFSNLNYKYISVTHYRKNVYTNDTPLRTHELTFSSFSSSGSIVDTQPLRLPIIPAPKKPAILPPPIENLQTIRQTPVVDNRESAKGANCCSNICNSY